MALAPAALIPTPLVKFLAKILPTDVHPMVVHFPIALLYSTAVVDLLALWQHGHGRDRFMDRAGFWLLTAAGVSLVVAAGAGFISEQSVHWTPATIAILTAHQHFGELTFVFALMAWVAQIFTPFSTRRRSMDHWSLFDTGRGRVSPLVALLVVVATVLVTITGSLGGDMVYQHCVGIPTSTCNVVVPAHRG